MHALYRAPEAVPTAAGSRVHLDAVVGTRGVMTLLAPVIRGAIAREDGVQLTRRKAWVEG